ncbi:acetylcholinesterase [Rhipicephalus sanguineus]|uniref:acetylcholinesterase n=1 Tax=Rhipicephalus sanguineus TaxID=34632 RepID=UPI0020C202DD|nr:acetylcholinesterase [Rhipicephalus sanguineus]
MVLLALFAVTLALAMAVLGFVERQRNREHPVLKGVFGTVRGKRIVITDQGNEFHVYAFLGIPFAKPPLGTLRFKPPVPLDEELYDGQYLSALGDLVVVVPNYRVGALGFLSGPSAGVLPGNAGLYDQRLALSWTLNNIENFGGNASRLVLAGHDAGAASLGYHLFNGDAALFTRNVARYILQSGGPFNRYKDDGVEGTRLLATNLQCGNDLSVPTALRCLQNSDVDAVARSPLASRFVPLLNRTPVARGPSSSADKRKEVGPQGKQFLLGRVVREGVYPWFVEHKRTGSSEPLHLATRLIGRKALEQWQTATGVTLRPLDGDTLYQQAVGDILEVCPMSDLAELLQVLENRVYVYVLGYRPRYSSWPDLTEAVRFEDMHLVFGMPFRPGVPSSELDKQWSRTMIQVWSTFAHTGKAPALNGSRWPVYDPLQPSYMKLGVDGVSMEHDAKRGRCDFLRSHRNTY